MMAALRDLVANPADPALQVARTVLIRVFGPPETRTFGIQFWDDSCDGPDATPQFTLVIRRPGALWRLLLMPNERRVGEAYVRGDLDVEGDLEAATSLAETISGRVGPWYRAIGLLLPLVLPAGRAAANASGGLHAYPRAGLRHSRRRDAAAIHYHYDVGNDFYQLWLDRRMVYSCAYFPSGRETLDEAQEAKLDLICRKLRLRPGERFLDIGCGWGALVMHAACRYGVRATGITISRQQAALARTRIDAAGLGGQCRVELCDYRDLPEESFDKIASVGMVEHVGHGSLAGYFRRCVERLAPGGLLLNHGIVLSSCAATAAGRWWARRVRRWTSFIDRYVFPDGELVTPAEMLAAAMRAGFEVRDVESLREHYACTLRHWGRRIEARGREASALAGEPAYRTWRLYMAGCARAFSLGRISVVQMLFARPEAGGLVNLPPTRADLYR